MILLSTLINAPINSMRYFFTEKIKLDHPNIQDRILKNKCRIFSWYNELPMVKLKGRIIQGIILTSEYRIYDWDDINLRVRLNCPKVQERIHSGNIFRISNNRYSSNLQVNLLMQNYSQT